MTGPSDPQLERVDQLLVGLAGDRLGVAERTELALYVRDKPELVRRSEARLQEAGRIATLGAGWMARLEGDSEIQKAETTTLTRIERGGGLTMIGVGFVMTFILPVALAGSILLGVGFALLLFSFIRVRLSTASKDPYRDVER